jgi:Tfp pilus assembly protein FimV
MKNQIQSYEQILASLEASDMTKTARKTWLTKALKEHEKYCKSIETKFYRYGWTHYYGNPLNEDIIAAEFDQLEELKIARDMLDEPWKKATKSSKASKPTKVEKPSASDTAIVELTKSMANLTSQLTELTKVVAQNSKDIAVIQQSVAKLNEPAPKREAKPKRVKTTAKVVEDKVAVKKSSTSFLRDLFGGTFVPVKAETSAKSKKSTKVDRKEYNPHGNGFTARKKAYMEVR